MSVSTATELLHTSGAATHLPVLGDGIPDPHLPGVAGGDQLVAHEEERLHRDVQAEDACGTKDSDELLSAIL